MITIHRRMEPRWVELEGVDGVEFKIRPLNSPTKIDVQNEISFKKSGGVNISGDGVMAACRYGLMDWKGIKDENGEDLPFSARHIEWLPHEYLKFVASQIIHDSMLSEDERKNS